MPAETAASINDVKGAARRGHRIGNWLTREQAQELLPDQDTLKGKRDYAILALLLGCDLRRNRPPWFPWQGCNRNHHRRADPCILCPAEGSKNGN